MASNNTVYENSVIEAKLTDLVDTKLNVRNLLTVDTSLTEGVGLRKTINKYTYTGSVETLGKGAGNTNKGVITFTPKHYDVKRYQQTFEYNDIDVLTDPYMLDAAMAGAAAVMANQVTDEFFGEMAGISNRHYIAGSTVAYDDIVDALAELDREVEDGMFIIMGSDGRKAIRKDSDFIASHQGDILYTGQFGTLCGLPVVFSKKVPSGQVIITSKDAVRFFVKKEATVEQDRDIETKENTVVYERHGLIALVDDTSSVILGKQATALTVTLTGSGTSRTPAVTEAKLAATDTYKYAIGIDAPLDDEDVSGWTTWDGSSAITGVAVGDKITIAEVDTDGKCAASGSATVA